MSDALSDISRDEARARYFSEFLNDILVYIQNPTEENKNAALESAERTDSVIGGYWGGGATKFRKGLEEQLRKLSDGDKAEWARLLRCSSENFSSGKLLKLSPFAGCLLCFVNYGYGFAHNKHEGMQEMLDKIIGEKYGWMVYDCDKYLVVLHDADPEKAIEGAEVFWFECGVLGVEGPRKQDN